MGIKMNHLSHRQMSESFLTAAFLSISGGLQDAYTYLFRGKVFANAQTGNIVLLSACVVDRNWYQAAHYLIPLLFFALGIAAAEWVRLKYQRIERLHWRQLVVLSEIILLFAVGFFPVRLNLFANALVSFSCAMQVQTFRKVNGYAFASTMCIGNIRSGMESLCVYGKTKDKEKLYKAGHYLGIIAMFAVGAAVGGHLILLLHERTIWVSCGLLFVGFLLMFIKEELEEHPRILEEEQEIRKNIQNIREEAKEVENIIKDDLKK